MFIAYAGPMESSVMVFEVLWSKRHERGFDPVHRCTRIREAGSNLQVLSRKVELGFGQLVEAVYVVRRERQVQGSKVRVKLLHCARSDDRRGHTGTALDPSKRNGGYRAAQLFCDLLQFIKKIVIMVRERARYLIASVGLHLTSVFPGIFPGKGSALQWAPGCDSKPHVLSHGDQLSFDGAFKQ